MLIFSSLLHVKVKLRASKSFFTIYEEKSKVDAVLLIYYIKIVLIPKIIVQMCIIIHCTYCKTRQYLIIRKRVTI